jgi:hypothetical protein
MSWILSYKSAIRQLSTPSLYSEALKLENSIKHLRQSNEELRLHSHNQEEDTSWIAPVISENEESITKQTEQVKLVKLELASRGARSEHAEPGILNHDPVNNTSSGSHRDADRMELDDPTNGVEL